MKWDWPLAFVIKSLGTYSKKKYGKGKKVSKFEVEREDHYNLENFCKWMYVCDLSSTFVSWVTILKVEVVGDLKRHFTQ